MQRGKWGARVAALLTVLGLLVGCSGAGSKPAGNTAPATPAAPAKPAGPKVLRVRDMGDVTTLDPAQIKSPNDNFLAWNIFEPLVAYKVGTPDLVPALAEKWEIAADNKAITFHLRKGVQWHKGYGEFTSDDVKFTFDRVRDPKEKSPYQSDFAVIDKIETPDPYTVKISLKAATADSWLPGVLTFRPGWIVSKKAVTEKGSAKFGMDPIGTGPFIFESYTQGTRGVLKANPTYWGGKPKLDEVDFIPILKDEVAEQALKSGDLDVAHLRDPDVYQRLKADKNFKVQEAVSTGIWNLYMNMSRVLKDDRLRQAVMYAVDKKAIADQVLGGIAVPATGYVNPNFPSYVKDVKQYEANPAKAKQILQDAGAVGTKITLLISTLAPWPLLAPVLKQQLEDVGFKVDLQVVEYATWFTVIAKNDFDLGGMGIVRPPVDDVLLNNLGKDRYGQAGNFAQYPGVDDLLQKALASTGDAKKQAFQAMQKKVAEDAPVDSLFYLKVLVATRPNVTGFPVGLQNDTWLLDTDIK